MRRSLWRATASIILGNSQAAGLYLGRAQGILILISQADRPCWTVSGIPTVAVFLSGRPMWMNRELNASNAFVSAWLPGSEGGYAMDVLFGKTDAGDAVDFKGTLPYSWPRTAIQTPLNYDDENYDPLFAYGYGLSYAKGAKVGVLPEDAGVDLSATNESEFFKAGKAVFPWEMIVGDSSGRKTVKTSQAASPGGLVEIISADDGVQENIRTLSFASPAWAMLRPWNMCAHLS